MMRWHPRSKHLAILGGLILFVALSLMQHYNLVTADLGRHIVNGRELWSHPELLSTNFYSCTHTTYTFVNHHWLYGVMVYGVSQVFGMGSLTLLNMLLGASAFSLVLLLSYKKSGFGPALIAGFLAIPPITSRVEVRPELVSMLGLAIYLVVLTLYSKKQLSFIKTASILLLTQLVWQNAHLFFVFGLVVLFLFWIESLLLQKKQHIQKLGVLGIVSGLLVLVNPNGIAGAMQPFTIFENYGYRVAENQTLWFMISRFANPEHIYLAILLLAVATLCIPVFTQKEIKQYFLPIALFLVFGFLALQVIRTRSFFGLISIYSIASLLPVSYLLAKPYIEKMRKQEGWYFVLSPLIFIGFVLIIGSGLFRPISSLTGIGPLPKVDAAANFITTNKLQGPIFNNYDIGGYLIFYLYPEKVYVDNRPEAYPAAFFTDDYIVPQENPAEWKRLQQQYDFNLIVFNRLDLTPWGQAFLIARIQDSDWTPVFVDEQVIIFLSNRPENAELTKKLALPKELFSYSQ